MTSLNTSSLSEADRTIRERTTFRWQGTLLDEDGVAIPVAQLFAVTLTISDALSGEKLVNARDVKNANGGTITAAGVMTLQVYPADNRMVNQRLPVETHRATITYSWDGGDNSHWHCIELLIQNHPDVA